MMGMEDWGGPTTVAEELEDYEEQLAELLRGIRRAANRANSIMERLPGRGKAAEVEFCDRTGQLLGVVASEINKARGRLDNRRRDPRNWGMGGK